MASVSKRPGGKYRARCRDAANTEHARHFTRKVDAQCWLDEQTAAIITGHWARAGRVTVAEYAARWRAAQAWVRRVQSSMGQPSSAKAVYTVLRGLMRTAVIDRVIAASPRDGVSAPGTVGRRSVSLRRPTSRPWPTLCPSICR